MQEGKVIGWGSFTNSWGKKTRKSKAERERYAQVNAEFQRIARRDKAFFKKQCKNIGEKSRVEKPRDLCKKTGDIKRIFHARMEMIKDRNCKDLTETQEVKKRWQEYTEFSSVQSLSHVRHFATTWTAACQASLSIPNSHSSPKPMSFESVMPSSPLILGHPLLLLPSIFPSIRIFSNESALCLRCPKYWSFSFNISPSNEYPGLISFRTQS